MNSGSAEPRGARLQSDLGVAMAELAAKADALHDFRVHLLTSDKFQGEDEDGGRRDWIAVTDALAWLDRIRTAEGRP